MPKSITYAGSATINGRKVSIRSQADLHVLRLLSKARGEWVDPVAAGMGGNMLSRFVASLRNRYAIPVESQNVQDGNRFFNRHRLSAPVQFNGGQDHD
jgi:hypothetical protein